MREITVNDFGDKFVCAHGKDEDTFCKECADQCQDEGCAHPYEQHCLHFSRGGTVNEAKPNP